MIDRRPPGRRVRLWTENGMTRRRFLTALAAVPVVGAKLAQMMGKADDPATAFIPTVNRDKGATSTHTISIWYSGSPPERWAEAKGTFTIIP